ncbi:MAG: TonB-dependent receptor, partial [Chitinophagaceae bacterium]
MVNSGQGDDAGEGSTLQQDLIQIPSDVNIADLQDYTGNPFNTPSYFYTPYATNPYFTINENNTNVSGNNIFGNVNLSYKITPELTATYQVGGNYRNERLKSYGAIVDYLPGSPQDLASANRVVGGVTEQSIQRSEFDTFLNLNYRQDLSDSFRFDATAGVTYNQREVNTLLASITVLDVPNFYEIYNTATRPNVTQGNSLRKTAAAYLQTELSFKERLFLTLSGRVDKTSTLPDSDNVYFYPAASLSGIVYQSGSDYLKLRGGFAAVANDTDPYQLFNSIGVGSGAANFGTIDAPVDGINFFEFSSLLGNPNLKPERTSETELGVETNLFGGRLTFDGSVYYSKTTDLLVRQSIDPSTGFTARTGNAADLENRGIEIALGITPVKTTDFAWTLNYTFSKNMNEVTKVVGGGKTLLNSAYGVNFYAEEGQPVGTFYARTPVVNEQGQYVVNPDTGFYEVSAEENRIGNSQRDFIMGLQTTFTYKNLALSFAMDWKQGGEMYSYTKRLTNFVGNGIETTYNDRQPFIIPNSVVDDGTGKL